MVESEQLRAKNRDIGIDSKWEESVDKSKIPDLIIGDRNLSMLECLRLKVRLSLLSPPDRNCPLLCMCFDKQHSSRDGVAVFGEWWSDANDDWAM